MRKFTSFLILFGILSADTALAQASPRENVRSIVVRASQTVLNPVLHPDQYATLSVTGLLDNGKTMELNGSQILFTAKNKLISGKGDVIRLDGNKVIPGEGGIATITALYQGANQTLSATVDVVVRPYYRDYHQTLVMKLMLGMEGQPVARLTNEPLFRKKHDVICTFEQALELIRKTDALTVGMPKILYLVGWQNGGHDHQYPAWDQVNPRLKRPQDATALESLRWLIREGRKYNTTVSLHINMADAYQHSSLWNEYVKKDIIARDVNGKLMPVEIQIQGDSMYRVSYTREWSEGLAQKRIDALIEMIPELKEGHTIHVDVFIARNPGMSALSPWHAKKENGGVDMYQEAQTQHKIFRYWRERGFDVTGEGLFWEHPPGEGFYGLQPMAWWYPTDQDYQMQTPEILSARGRTDRKGDGDFRFGSSMQGEEIFLKDRENLPDFLGQFCRTTLPWQYLSQHERMALIGDTLFYSGGVKAAREHGHAIIRRGNFILRDNNDLFVPALWKEKTIIAYSEQGYTNRTWTLPDKWQSVRNVDLYKIKPEGPQLLAKDQPVKESKVILSLRPATAVMVVPAGTQLKK